jgi:hypothetical protein
MLKMLYFLLSTRDEDDGVVRSWMGMCMIMSMTIAARGCLGTVVLQGCFQ